MGNLIFFLGQKFWQKKMWKRTHARGSPIYFLIGGQLEAHLSNLQWQSGLGNLAIVFVNALTTWQCGFDKVQMTSHQVNLAK
jgi:hypothetical protein